ncbi:hypothetical protein Ddc_07824 [Ditylenchus destructor]|nr:hypothetical protein Ddc_07824 [Ditylenchus destructor]
MATLDKDLLYNLAETLLSRSDEESSFGHLHPLVAANFMQVNKNCRAAMLWQFSRMKLIDFYRDNDEIAAKFYQSTEYMEPGETILDSYTADRWFVAFLLQNDRFKPKRINFYRITSDSQQQSCSKNLENFHCSKDTKPIDCFLKILGLEDIMNTTDYDSDLYLDRVNALDDSTYLDVFLTLNSRELTLDFECFPTSYWNGSRVTADRTEKVCLKFRASLGGSCSKPDEEFPAAQWIDLITFTLESCSNLKELSILAICDDYDPDADVLLNTLNTAVRSFLDVIFPATAKDGCEIIIEYRGFLDSWTLEDLPATKFPFLKMGEESKTIETLEPNEISRAIKFEQQSKIIYSILRAEDPDALSEANNDVINDIFDQEEEDNEYSDFEDYEDSEDY